MKKPKATRKRVIPDPIPKRYFVVYDAIFKQRVHVLLNHTPEQYQQWLNRNKVKDIDVKNFGDFQAWVSEFTTEKDKTERIIFMPTFNWAIKHQGSLIHEITHIIIKIWQFNNIPFNADTQEFIAHSIGNMYEDIAEKLLTYTLNK